MAHMRGDLSKELLLGHERRRMARDDVQHSEVAIDADPLRLT